MPDWQGNPNVFDVAYNVVNNVDEIVENRIRDARSTSSTLQSSAIGTIDALSHVDLNFNAGVLPAPPNIDPNIDLVLDLPAISPTSFGEITSAMPDAPSLDAVPDLDGLDIPEFESSINSLNIPEAPAWSAPGEAPARPDTGEVVLPEEPSFSLPDVPTLVELDIPAFDGLNLPAFDATMPEFAGSAIPGILQWSEPQYHPVILNEMMDKLRAMWNGELGIPAAVEQAMYERAASREDMTAEREIDGVAEEFSLRGFTMPTGMQAARVDQLRQDLAVKKLALNREILLKLIDVQVENVRFACQQAVAAENVLVNLHLNAAQRAFEAARFQIESQINIYNAQIALFNARMNGYQVSAQVFDTLVKAELTKIEVFKAEIEAEVAKGQINEQKVRTYSAQVQALMSYVEIYKAKMQGAQVQSDVIRNRIEAYKADVQAYAERIAADKTKFDAYESQVKGEAAKAGIIDAEARAYAALIQGKSSVAEIQVKRAELVVQKNRSFIEAYSAELDAEKARIGAQSAVIQANAQAYIADTQRFSAVAGAETAKAQLEVSAKETEMRTNIAFYQAQVQAYISNMEQLIRKAGLIIDALKAAGQISSTLAAGAMAGVHVGATLSGGGSVGASGTSSDSYQKSDSYSKTENYNYEGT